MIDTRCCKYCPNNPSVNPYTSGICNCTLPYLTHTSKNTITVTNTDEVTLISRTTGITNLITFLT